MKIGDVIKLPVYVKMYVNAVSGETFGISKYYTVKSLCGKRVGEFTRPEKAKVFAQALNAYDAHVDLIGRMVQMLEAHTWEYENENGWYCIACTQEKPEHTDACPLVVLMAEAKQALADPPDGQEATK